MHTHKHKLRFKKRTRLNKVFKTKIVLDGSKINILILSLQALGHDLLLCAQNHNNQIISKSIFQGKFAHTLTLTFAFLYKWSD